jgi:beta-lactamase regulating signal transducer with metallopeptidase domain
MMQTIADLAIILGQSPELSLVVKMTIAVALGLAAGRLARAARASVRHLVLTSTFAALLALPAAILIVPGIAIELPGAGASANDADALAARTADVNGSGGVRVGAGVNADGSAASLRSAGNGGARGASANSVGAWFARMPWMAMMRTVWLAGAALLLGLLAIALVRLRALSRTGLPWLERRDEAAHLAREAGVPRPVTVMLHERIVAPLTCGWRNPVIVFPADAREWSDGDVRRVLLHELEHVRRGDWIVQLAARATCAIYWFHPLVWTAWRQLCLEAERACDDAVVRSEAETDYAEQLVLLARRMSDAPAQPMVAMASRSDLSARVTALLDRHQRRGRAGALTFVAAAGAAAFLVFTIAPLRAVAALDSQSADAVVRDGRGAGKGNGAGAGMGTGAGSGGTGAVVAGASATGGVAGGASGGQTVIDNKRRGSRSDRALGEALIEAADDGDIQGLEELLAAGVDVNTKVYGDGSALIAASRKGEIAAVKFLLERGAAVNMGVKGDGSPLIMAAAEGHVDVVTLLLQQDADIDLVVDGDENALIQAAAKGHLDVVKLLVSRGANVNARVQADMNFNGQPRIEWRTPLGMARRGGHTAVIAFLQSAGAVE